MATLCRVRTEFTGFPGGPGVATMYFRDVATALPSLRTFWAGIAGNMPSNVFINIPNEGEIIEDSTGVLTGGWAATAVATITGSGAGTYASPAGAHINWLTGAIRDGRRLKGRTFLVPLTSNCFQTDGSLAAVIPAAFEGYGNALISEQDASFAVWHRPREAKPADGSRPEVLARAGAHDLVTSSKVPDRVAVLRSRRD